MTGGAAPNKTQTRSVRQRRKPFQSARGEEFEVQESEAQESDAQESEAKESDAATRGFLARLIGWTIVAAAAVTGGYGLIAKDFLAVIAVWSVASPISGALVAYYFGPQRNDTG